MDVRENRKPSKKEELAEFFVRLPRKPEPDRGSMYSLKLKLPLSSTGKELKLMVSLKSGIPKSEMKLLHKGHPIELEQSLLEQNLQSKDQITGIWMEGFSEPLSEEVLYQRELEYAERPNEYSDEEFVDEEQIDPTGDFEDSSDYFYESAGYFNEMKEVIQKRSLTAVSNEVRIVLIGKTGNGKSALGNSILGKDIFPSEPSAMSVTKTVSFERAFRFGRNLLVVDTPGLFDTNVTNDKTLYEIGKCVGISAPGIHAAILVTSIGRVTPEDQESFDIFVRYFGEDVCKFTILVFNRSKELKGKKKEAFKKYLDNAHESIQKLRQKIDDRIFLIDNNEKRKKKEKKIPDLLEMIDSMVTSNNGEYYTNEMYRKAELLIKEEELRRRNETEKRKEEERRKVAEPFLKKLKERDALVEKLERSHFLATMKADALSKQLHEEKGKLENLQHEKHCHELELANLQEKINSMTLRETERSKEIEDMKKVIGSLLHKKDKDSEVKKKVEESLLTQREIVLDIEEELHKRYEERNRIREDVKREVYKEELEKRKNKCSIS